MSPDTAEPAIAEPANGLIRAPDASPSTAVGEDASSKARLRLPGLGGSRSARADIETERMVALRDVWRALWSSRLLVWAAGVGAVLTLGSGPVRHAFDPPGLTRGLGRLGEVLAAPAARWDAAWYLVIAHYGYRPDLGSFTASRTAFFPLYPLGVHMLGGLGLPLVLGGVLLSTAMLAAGLYGLHRLTTLEVRRLRASDDRGFARLDASEIARTAVLLTAVAPMAFYFSAVYSESLYLGLSVGVFLCARRGKWAACALLAALAAATRSTGIVLLAPMVLIYLYGPREDRDPDFPSRRSDRAKRRESFGVRFRPRYRVRRDALWFALAPAGVCLYMAHLALYGGDALAPFHAEGIWNRHLAGPYGGVWTGAQAAFEGLRQLLSFQRQHVYFPAAGGSPFINAGHNLLLFGFLLAAIPAVIGVLRLLPFSYGIYALASLALPLSYPVASQPLMSLPRFLVVLFPLNMWLAIRLASRPAALTRIVLLASAVAMMFFVGEFATWHWVA